MNKITLCCSSTGEPDEKSEGDSLSLIHQDARANMNVFHKVHKNAQDDGFDCQPNHYVSISRRGHKTPRKYLYL